MWLAMLGMEQTPPKAAQRQRWREIQVAPGVFAPGPLNTITDLRQTRVDHSVLI
ncbi:MAG: hypothetical protein ABSH05_12495 [Bryobacteraceae bacterium]|jgi:D-aminopeptidase